MTEPSDSAETGASDAPSPADDPDRAHAAAWCAHCRELYDPGPQDDPCQTCGRPATAWDADALYRALAPGLVRYVRSLLRTWNVSDARVDAEGAVNEAFEMMISRSRWSDRPIDNPTAWLYVVARHRAARAVMRELRIDDGENRGSVEDHDSVRWSSLARRPSANDERGMRLALQAMAELPYSQRAATYLQTVEGWTLEQIAEYLDCAASTAGVHVYRGKVRVRERLNADWEREPSSGIVIADRTIPRSFMYELSWGWAHPIMAALILLNLMTWAALCLARWLHLAFWLAGVLVLAGALVLGGVGAAGLALWNTLHSRRVRRGGTHATRRAPD